MTVLIFSNDNYLTAANRFSPFGSILQLNLAELAATNTGISVGTSLKYRISGFTVKPALSSHSKRKKEDQKLFFKTDYRLMQVKSIAECSKGSILQYF